VNPLRELHGHTITEVVGRGGFATVYRALASNGDCVALKVLHGGSSDQLKRRFARGAHSQGLLEHRGIVRIRESFADSITMDYVSDIDLKKEIQRLRVMRRRLRTDTTDVVIRAETPLIISCEVSTEPSRMPRLDESYMLLVAQWGFQIADALSVAHTNGIIHRDIKPSNLLLDEDGKIAVTDFDLAFQIGSDEGLTLTGDGACTLDYCSPEQALREPVHDFRTDVYSLGVVLLELLTLTLPFERFADQSNDIGGTVDATAAAPRADRLARGIPATLADIVERALRKTPEDRYQDAGEMAQDLQRFLQGDSFRVRRPSTATKTARLIARHKKGAIVTTSLTVAGTGFMAALWLIGGIGDRERFRDAWSAGDIAGVVAASEKLQGPFSYFSDAPRRAVLSNPLHPFRQIDRALRRDLGQGQRLAASYLREDAPVPHPLLIRQFQRWIVNTETRPTALYWIGRALLEAPCNSRARTRACDRIRELSWGLLDSPSETPGNKLWAIAIVATTGSESDGIRLVDWLSARPFNLEQSRLGIVAMQQIAQRIWSCRESPEPDPAILGGAGIRLREKLYPLVDTWLQVPDLTKAEKIVLVHGRDQFASSAALHEVMCGNKIRCEDWSMSSRYVAFLDLLSRDPQRAVRSLDRPPEFRSDEIEIWTWRLAVAAKLLANPGLRNSMRRALVERTRGVDARTRTEVLRWFDEAYDDGSAPWEDRIPTKLDDESLLRTKPTRAVDTIPCEVENDPGVLVSWSFISGRPLKSRRARDPLVENAQFRIEGTQMSHLRLWGSGQSVVRLGFDLEDRFVGELALEIEHLAASRIQFPGEGEAVIRVDLDGAMVDEKKAFHNNHDDPAIILIHEGSLAAGRHTLTFRVVANTTTYWIKRVRLRRR
jgi:serine/threonine protein kinase